jgi:HlyD family secretion protein
MKKLALPALAVAMAVTVATFYYRAKFSEKTAVDTMLVSGNIEAHESLVSFKTVQSRIVALPFDEGAWVNSGTLLARLEDADYRKQVDVDEAALMTQRQNLAEAVENAAAARATVVNDRADLAQKELDYERDRRLLEAQVIAAQTRDLALTALKQSRATLVRDQASAAAAEQNIAVAQANIESARQSLDLARITLGYTVLRAPFSGVVLVRQAELGEVMQPGAPVVTLADLSHVWLRAYIPEPDLTRVGWGQPAVITTDAYRGEKFNGRVSFIASDAEFTPKSVETHTERVTLVYRIKIDIDNPEHKLKPGMPADALIGLAGESQQRSGVDRWAPGSSRLKISPGALARSPPWTSCP